METTQAKSEQTLQKPTPQQAAGSQTKQETKKESKQGTPKIQVPKKKRKWPKRLLIGAVVVAALFFFVVRPMMGSGQQVMAGSYIAETAQKRDLVVSVTSTGTVTPIESYKVSTLVSGEVVEAPFEEGDVVEKGSLLYRFDAGDAENAVQQARLGVEQAELAYRSALESVSPYATATGVVQKLYVEVGDSVSVGTPIAEIGDNSVMTIEMPFHSEDAAALYVGQSAVLTIEGTMENVDGTIVSVSGATEVSAGGALVRQVKFSVKNPGALTSTTMATAVVGNVVCAGSGTFAQNAQQTVTAMSAGEITSLKVSAGSKVSYGQTIAVIGGTNGDATLENARIGLDNAKLSLDSRIQALENYEITAPISGTVIEKNFKAGDNVENNAVTAAGGNMAIIYDMSTLTFDMRVDELDINKIQVGQEVEITADALANQTFRGRVDKVNINGTTANGVTTYPVTVVVENPENLLPGMNVSAKVLVEQAGNVLTVPVDAVQRGNFVYVAGAGALDANGNLVNSAALEQRAVTLGRSDSDYIEILTGLEDGETVYIPNAASSYMDMMMGG